MNEINEILTSAIIEGVDAVNERDFSRLWENAGSNRYIAIAWLVRNTMREISIDPENYMSVIKNFSDFTLKFFGKKYVSFAFDLLSQAIVSNDMDRDEITERIKTLAIAAKESRYSSDEKMFAVTLGLTGAYYHHIQNFSACASAA